MPLMQIFIVIANVAAVLLAVFVVLFIRMRRKWQDDYYLLERWRQFGKDMAVLHPEVYESLRDKQSGGDRWDLRKIAREAHGVSVAREAKLLARERAVLNVEDILNRSHEDAD